MALQAIALGNKLGHRYKIVRFHHFKTKHKQHGKGCCGTLLLNVKNKTNLMPFNVNIKYKIIC